MRALVDAFAEVVGNAGVELPGIRWSQAHRWLYALVDVPLDVGCLWDADLGIGACGDWCNGARIEGAWLSGEALAGRVPRKILSIRKLAVIKTEN